MGLKGWLIQRRGAGAVHDSGSVGLGLGSLSFMSGRVLLNLRDAQHLFDGGDAGLDLVPAVRAQGAHAVFHRAGGDGGGRRAVHDQRPQRFV